MSNLIDPTEQPDIELTMPELHTSQIIDVPTVTDSRGSLSFTENPQIPFLVKRLYYFFDTSPAAVRGEHGHRRLQQMIVCLHGAVDLRVYNKYEDITYRLESPTQAVYIPKMSWRRLDNFGENTICIVLASEQYDKSDYIYTFEEFLTEIA